MLISAIIETSPRERVYLVLVLDRERRSRERRAGGGVSVGRDLEITIRSDVWTGILGLFGERCERVVC